MTKINSSHIIELDFPSGIWPKFHVELLKKDPQNPLPSGISRDSQPPPLINTNGEEERIVENILIAEKNRIGRGFRRKVLVK